VSEDAPTQFVPMSDTLQSSHVMAVLDPRVDIQRDISHDPVIDDPLVDGIHADPATETSAGQQQEDGDQGQGDAQQVQATGPFAKQPGADQGAH